jgi:hypothetical protein
VQLDLICVNVVINGGQMISMVTKLCHFPPKLGLKRQ